MSSIDYEHTLVSFETWLSISSDQDIPDTVEKVARLDFVKRECIISLYHSYIADTLSLIREALLR